MEEAEGFEVTDYGNENKRLDAMFSVIQEIISDQCRTNPAMGVRVSFNSNLMKVTFHSFERMAPTRMKEIEDNCKKVLDETFKNLKKEFKERTKKPLKATEKKDMANYSIQKVSLNERYMFSSWRFYELG